MEKILKGYMNTLTVLSLGSSGIIGDFYFLPFKRVLWNYVNLY
jgi:hypothetical protein